VFRFTFLRTCPNDNILNCCISCRLLFLLSRFSFLTLAACCLSFFLLTLWEINLSSRICAFLVFFFVGRFLASTFTAWFFSSLLRIISRKCGCISVMISYSVWLSMISVVLWFSAVFASSKYVTHFLFTKKYSMNFTSFWLFFNNFTISNQLISSPRIFHT